MHAKTAFNKQKFCFEYAAAAATAAAGHIPSTVQVKEQTPLQHLILPYLTIPVKLYGGQDTGGVLIAGPQ